MTADDATRCLGQRYALTRRIAGGGMGEVWEGRDDVLGRTVAVKLIRPGLAEDESFAARFRTEARLAAQLAHGNIAQVYDYGQDGDQAFLVMEFVRGQSLAQIIDLHGSMAPAHAVHVLTQAAEALQCAHESGVVHRDIKPANIIVTGTGTAKLTDFGIARALGEAKLTRAGEVMGTPQYLAPEAALGREVTGAADVYALGVVAYELLAGRRPFHADSAVSLAMMHVHEPVPPLPEEVPRPVAEVIERALAKDPGQRPASARTFADDLTAALRRSDVTGPRRHSPAPSFAAPSAPMTDPISPVPAPAGSGPVSPPYGHLAASPPQGTPVPYGQPYGVAALPAPGSRRPRSRAARGIGLAWVLLAAACAGMTFLPWATWSSSSFSPLHVAQAEALYTPVNPGVGNWAGWFFLILCVVLALLGLPHALGRANLATPIIAVLLCLLAALFWMAILGTFTGGTEDHSPLRLSVTPFLVGVAGTGVLGLAIAGLVKHR